MWLTRVYSSRVACSNSPPATRPSLDLRYSFSSTRMVRPSVRTGVRPAHKSSFSASKRFSAFSGSRQGPKHLISPRSLLAPLSVGQWRERKGRIRLFRFGATPVTPPSSGWLPAQGRFPRAGIGTRRGSRAKFPLVPLERRTRISPGAEVSQASLDFFCPLTVAVGEQREVGGGLRGLGRLVAAVFCGILMDIVVWHGDWTLRGAAKAGWGRRRKRVSLAQMVSALMTYRCREKSIVLM